MRDTDLKERDDNFMKRRYSFFVVLAGLAVSMLLVACSNASTTSNPPTPNATAIAEGQQLYLANCASCHGTDGAGGKNIEGATAADIRFAALNEMYNGDWSLAKRAILDGKDEEGENLAAAMPRWRGKLSESQVDDIVQYLQTLK
jgi:mono/diheme cytochrome c family protein